MILIIALAIIITVIITWFGWKKRMSPYHILARFGWLISGFLCLGGIAEIDGVGYVFPLLLLSMGCFFMLIKMLTQPE